MAQQHSRFILLQKPLVELHFYIFDETVWSLTYVKSDALDYRHNTQYTKQVVLTFVMQIQPEANVLNGLRQ